MHRISLRAVTGDGCSPSVTLPADETPAEFPAEQPGNFDENERDIVETSSEAVASNHEASGPSFEPNESGGKLVPLGHRSGPHRSGPGYIYQPGFLE